MALRTAILAVGCGQAIPLWLKIGWTLFALVLIPVYWKHYGPANFLWFSDIALFAMIIALWLENALLASMMLLAIALPELAWSGDFFAALLTALMLLFPVLIYLPAHLLLKWLFHPA